MNLDFLQQLCNNWPGVTTDVKWGNDFVFSVAEKMFCVCSLEPPLKIGFKVGDEEFEELSVRDGFMPAPYMARNKWVLVTNPGKVNRNEWEQFVKHSYELVKSKLPKRTQQNLSEGTSYKPAPAQFTIVGKQGTRKDQGGKQKKESKGKKIEAGKLNVHVAKKKLKKKAARKSN